jgi:protein TonB
MLKDAPGVAFESIGTRPMPPGRLDAAADHDSFPGLRKRRRKVERIVYAPLDLRARHGTVLRRSLLIALLFHFLLFAFSPPFRFEVHRLKKTSFEVVEIVPEIEIPPPPEHLPRPRVNVEVSRVPLAEDRIAIPPSLVDRLGTLAPPPVSGPATSDAPVIIDQEPRLVRVVPPRYPDIAREAGIEGRVVVRVRVGADGRVTRAYVVWSDVTPDMEAAAVEAARRCLFEPARQGHAAVPADVAVPFIFRLD